MIIVEHPQVGDYIRMDRMYGFNFRQPFYGEVVLNTETSEGYHYKIKILCGAYGSDNSWSRVAGQTFYLPINHNHESKLEYVYFREPDDEMWAAIAKEALAG